MSDSGSVIEIDLDSIVRDRVSKHVPQFVINWLKRLVHQEFINTYLRRGDEGVAFCRGTLDYLGVTIRVEGAENLPSDGRWCTFVSNHPLGAIDGVALGAIIGERYDGCVKYLVNDLLMNLKGLAPLCVPINKIGKQARNLPAMVEKAFSGENHVIMFPAGLCSRRMDDGVIRDLPWSKTFVQKSVSHQHDVVPVHFIGHNSNRFYNVSRWCKRLHLPNFAMALLPDEMYKAQGNTYTVRFGKPIPWQSFDGTRTTAEWAQYTKELVEKL
ncbi:MAG: glycerol acyltransferase [Bacteroidaceae bacterium]|nr:glycerol acyltransferase [Bacteroidaceae bacterium]